MKIKKKILAIIYRKSHGGLEFLALRNNSRDPIHGGDYYYVVTGGVDNGEELQVAVKREIEEETAIRTIKQIIDLDKKCEYTCDGEAGYLCQEAEFLVEVGDELVRLDGEHIAYEWLKREAFVDLIVWDDKKDLNKILDKLYEI